jgi:Kdo2-lipid IVA lauroyltransferase/acyltransferase
MPLLRLFSRLPFSVLFLISDFTFLIVFHVLRYRRRITHANLVACFPSKSKAEILEIEKRFYRNLCDFPAETLKLLTMTKEELLMRIVFLNAAEMQQYKDKGDSILMLASHTFNWEWLLAAGTLNLPMQVDFVYQPQGSAFANKVSLATRTRFGAHAVEREKVGREAVRRKDIVRATATVADQFPGHHFHRRYWTEFMGRPTAFFYGIAQLAVLIKSPVFFCEVVRRGRGSYHVTLKKIADTPATEEEALKVLDRYASETERMIREQPDNWLWSHNRWKNVDEEETPGQRTASGGNS